MKLSYLINEMSPKIDDICHYNTVVVREKGRRKSDYEEIPISGVKLDKGGKEVNILIRQKTANMEKKKKIITIRQLFKKLKLFMPQAADYDIFVSHPKIKIDKKWSVRLDVPIVGYGISTSGKLFGLFEKKAKKK